jgi:hypothetical protein
MCDTLRVCWTQTMCRTFLCFAALCQSWTSCVAILLLGSVTLLVYRVYTRVPNGCGYLAGYPPLKAGARNRFNIHSPSEVLSDNPNQDLFICHCVYGHLVLFMSLHFVNGAYAILTTVLLIIYHSSLFMRWPLIWPSIPIGLFLRKVHISELDNLDFVRLW